MIFLLYLKVMLIKIVNMYFLWVQKEIRVSGGLCPTGLYVMNFLCISFSPAYLT